MRKGSKMNLTKILNSDSANSLNTGVIKIMTDNLSVDSCNDSKRSKSKESGPMN